MHYTKHKLTINGESHKLHSGFSMRFVDESDSVVPVLYLDGKRVTDRWSLRLFVASSRDKKSNANTASVRDG